MSPYTVTRCPIKKRFIVKYNGELLWGTYATRRLAETAAKIDQKKRREK